MVVVVVIATASLLSFPSFFIQITNSNKSAWYFASVAARAGRHAIPDNTFEYKEAECSRAIVNAIAMNTPVRNASHVTLLQAWRVDHTRFRMLILLFAKK